MEGLIGAVPLLRPVAVLKGKHVAQGGFPGWQGDPTEARGSHEVASPPTEDAESSHPGKIPEGILRDCDSAVLSSQR